MKIKILDGHNNLYRFKEFNIDFYPVEITEGFLFKTTRIYYPVSKTYMKRGVPFCIVYADAETGEPLSTEICFMIHNLLEIRYKNNENN